MSIPIFFEPFFLNDFNNSENNLLNEEFSCTTFVDGGLISNFPLSIFDLDRKRSPKCPTFGLLIDETGEIKQKPNKIDNILELGMGLFNTTMNYGDKAYLEENPLARQRVIKMSNDIGDKKIGTTEFNLSDEDKIQLFKNGVSATLDFLKRWDFDAHKKLRESF